jgi:hypothetical protein
VRAAGNAVFRSQNLDAADVQRCAVYAVAAASSTTDTIEFARVSADYAIDTVTGPQTNFQAMLNAYSADAEVLDQGTSPVTLANSQLWPGRLPAWVADAWDQLKQALLAAGDNWIVWTDWYDERLKGHPANQDIEVARAIVPNEIWDKGPATLNAHVRELFRNRRISSYEISTHLTVARELEALIITWPELAIIGVRVALRALPLIEFNEPHFLVAVRAISSAWTAARYQLPADHRTHANAVYTDLLNSPIDLVSQISNTLLASANAAPLPAAAPYVIKGIDAFREATFRKYGNGAEAVFDLCLSQDLAGLRGAPDVAAIAELPIWLGDAPPEWAMQQWDSLKGKLLEAGWDVWVDWYYDRLAGTGRSKAHDFAYVQVPN